MKRLTEALSALHSIAWLLVPLYLVFVAPGQIGRTVHTEMEATRATLADQGDKTRVLISGQLTGIRSDVNAKTDAALGRVDAAIATVGKTEADANAQITAIRSDVLSLGLATDARLASIQADANSQLSGIRSDLKPTLENTASFTKDAQDSLDDSYWDLKASVESATVTANSLAQTSEVFAKAVPHMVQQADGITYDIHSITSDGKKAADKFIAPPTRWEKFKAIVTGALVVLVKAGL